LLTRDLRPRSAPQMPWGARLSQISLVAESVIALVAFLRMSARPDLLGIGATFAPPLALVAILCLSLGLAINIPHRATYWAAFAMHIGLSLALLGLFAIFATDATDSAGSDGSERWPVGLGLLHALAALVMLPPKARAWTREATRSQFSSVPDEN
jgi:hypothetical protein